MAVYSMITIVYIRFLLTNIWVLTFLINSIGIIVPRKGLLKVGNLIMSLWSYTNAKFGVPAYPKSHGEILR